MVSIKSPLIDAQMDEQTAAYVGILERQVVGLTITLSQLRAVLQAITGEAHEDYVEDMENKTIREVAEGEIQKRLGVTAVEAKHLAGKMFSGKDIGLNMTAQTTMTVDPVTHQPVVARETSE